MSPCRDNYRPFFEQTFPLLLRRVFGYDGASWLATLAQGGKEADISALLDLLSPTGAPLQPHLYCCLCCICSPQYACLGACRCLHPVG